MARHFRAAVFAAAILLYLVSAAVDWPILGYLLSFLSIAAILLSLPGANRLARNLSLLFLVSGNWMIWLQGTDPSEYLSAYGYMLHLLSLFAIIPLLAVPIQLGGYGKAIEHLLRLKVTTQQQLYRLISGFSFFLSSFMNLATLPMMYYSVKESVDPYPMQNRKQFISLGILHGFALPIMWTPVAPIVGVVFDLTGVSWSGMFPALLALSLGGLMLDWGIVYLTGKKLFFLQTIPRSNDQIRREMAATLEETAFDGEKTRWAKRKLVKLGLIITFFILLIAVAERVSNLGMIMIIVLLILPFSAVWSALLGKGKPFLHKCLKHVTEQIPDMADQFSTYLSAGFFVKAMEISGYNHEVNQLVDGLHHIIGDHLFLSLIPLIPLLLAYTGMHPVVAISLMTESLDPSLLGISVEKLTLALLGGAVTAFLMGPFNATLGIMSAIVKESPLRLSSWNWPFTISFIALLLAVLTLMP